MSFEPRRTTSAAAPSPAASLRLREACEATPETTAWAKPGTAFVRISRFFDVNRAVIGLKCIGAAQQTVDETVRGTRSKRVVFGAPLSAHQGVTFPLAEAATFLDHARLGCYRVLWMRQKGIPCQARGRHGEVVGPQGGRRDDPQVPAPPRPPTATASELPIQQRLRDVIGWQIGDGSEEVMKLLITRYLFDPRADSPPEAS